MATDAKCPFTGGTRGKKNRDWWPDQLDVQVLGQPGPLSNPMGTGFDYRKEFKTLDLQAVIKDLHAFIRDMITRLISHRCPDPPRPACLGGIPPAGSVRTRAIVVKALRLAWR
jgi:hypothetical protein